MYPYLLLWFHMLNKSSWNVPQESGRHPLWKEGASLTHEAVSTWTGEVIHKHNRDNLAWTRERGWGRIHRDIAEVKPIRTRRKIT